MRDIVAARQLLLALIGLVCFLPTTVAAQLTTATPVFTTTAATNGFVDDALADSVGDIREAIQNSDLLYNVAREEDARMTIVVSERFVSEGEPITIQTPGTITTKSYTSPDGQRTKSSSTIDPPREYSYPSSYVIVSAWLIDTWSGNFVRELVGDANLSWRGAARMVVRLAEQTVDANRDALRLSKEEWLSISPPSEEFIQRDLSLANTLQAGMSLDQVLAVMGEPVIQEFRGAINEWHYCETSIATDEATPLDLFIALFFQDNLLVEMSQYTVTLEDVNGAKGHCSAFAKRGSYRSPAWAMRPE